MLLEHAEDKRTNSVSGQQALDTHMRARLPLLQGPLLPTSPVGTSQHEMGRRGKSSNLTGPHVSLAGAWHVVQAHERPPAPFRMRSCLSRTDQVTDTQEVYVLGLQVGMMVKIITSRHRASLERGPVLHTVRGVTHVMLTPHQAGITVIPVLQRGD